ncbi:MAG: thioredoxin family protein [Planctomycetes bacterium]|nr:thioredoxin family protein [Planctomycetota bacterium]
MREILGRMTQWGAAIVVLSQVPILAAEPVVLPSVAKPPLVSDLPVVQPRPLFQHTTYPAAWRAAQKSNRPILVYVSMPNCHFCEKMKSQVFRLPRVRNLVSSSFETVSAGRYTHAKLVEKLRVKWYPTTVLVGPNNKILDVIEGYADANQFQQRLQTGLASASSTSKETQTR